MRNAYDGPGLILFKDEGKIAVAVNGNSMRGFEYQRPIFLFDTAAEFAEWARRCRNHLLARPYQFDQFGFITVENILGPTEVDELKAEVKKAFGDELHDTI